MNFFRRIGRWFARAYRSTAQFFREVAHELRRSHWPTRQELINYTAVVVIAVVVLAVVIFAFDTGIRAGLNALHPSLGG